MEQQPSDPDPLRYDPAALRTFTVDEVMEIYLYVRHDLAAKQAMVRDASQAMEAIRLVALDKLFSAHGKDFATFQGLRCRVHLDGRGIEVRDAYPRKADHHVEP